MVDEVVESNNIILFIDEIHNIFTSGIPGTPSQDWFNLKACSFERGFRCIRATTTEEYSAYFENDNALTRRVSACISKRTHYR